MKKAKADPETVLDRDAGTDPEVDPGDLAGDGTGDGTAPAWAATAVEMRALETLTPSPHNSRTHSDAQIDQVAASQREFGWTVPMLVDETGTVLAGHARLEAGKRNGYAEGPVMVARGWSDAQKRAYIIADNKLTENSGWDETILAAEFAALADEGFDLGLTGFDDAEIGTLLDDGGDDAEGPGEFREYGEDIETEFACPKCGYAWSGNAS